MYYFADRRMIQMLSVYGSYLGPLSAIPGRELWLDATDRAGMTLATGVSAWKDKTRNGKVVVQATGASQPTLATLNGLSILRFDGVDDAMALAAWPAAAQLANGFTVVTLADVKFANTTKGHPLYRFDPLAIGVQHEPSNDPNVPSRNRMESFTSVGASVVRATALADTVTGARVVSTVLDPAAATITQWKNGCLNGGPTALGGTANTTPSAGFRLASDGAVSFGQFDIGEAILFARALSLAERTTTERYLCARWGVQYGCPPNPPTYRGPILLASSVIDGVTVTVDYFVTAGCTSGLADMHSSELYHHTLVFRFSSAIRSFQITQLCAEHPEIQSFTSLTACDGYDNSTEVFTGIHAAASFSGLPGDLEQLDYTAGYQVVVVRNNSIAPDYGYSFAGYKNAKFLKVTD